jgi:hypothetical protein
MSKHRLPPLEEIQHRLVLGAGLHPKDAFDLIANLYEEAFEAGYDQALVDSAVTVTPIKD